MFTFDFFVFFFRSRGCEAEVLSILCTYIFAVERTVDWILFACVWWLCLFISYIILTLCCARYTRIFTRKTECYFRYIVFFLSRFFVHLLYTNTYKSFTFLRVLPLRNKIQRYTFLYSFCILSLDVAINYSAHKHTHKKCLFKCFSSLYKNIERAQQQRQHLLATSTWPFCIHFNCVGYLALQSKNHLVWGI